MAAQPTRQRFPFLAVFAAVWLAGLLLIPSTRWVVAELVRMLCTPPVQLVGLLKDLGVKEMPFGLEAGWTPRDASAAPLFAVARRHPADFSIQFAAARLQTAGGGLVQ